MSEGSHHLPEALCYPGGKNARAVAAYRRNDKSEAAVIIDLRKLALPQGDLKEAIQQAKPAAIVIFSSDDPRAQR
ncbi:MAG: hypothetical protein ONB30_10400 [candidate division KSB1 bacterium]|nr:hypothetical protein [candidate division KSB1 bacterium]